MYLRSAAIFLSAGNSLRITSNSVFSSAAAAAGAAPAAPAPAAPVKDVSEVAQKRREMLESFQLDTDAVAAGFESIDEEPDLSVTGVFTPVTEAEVEGGTVMFDRPVASVDEHLAAEGATVVIPDEFVQSISEEEYDEEYDEEVDFINKNFDEATKMPFYADEINAFKLVVTEGDGYATIYTCTPAIVFAIIGGIVIAALIGATCVSLILFKKKTNCTDEIKDSIKHLNADRVVVTTKEDISLFVKHCRIDLGIKAAGGISDLQDAEDFIALGAERLGTSRIVKIVKQFGYRSIPSLFLHLDMKNTPLSRMK